MRNKSYNSMRRTPDYWWDFRHYPNGDMTIILETDDPRSDDGVLYESEVLPNGSADELIERVQAVIHDLKEGRITKCPQTI